MRWEERIDYNVSNYRQSIAAAAACKGQARNLVDRVAVEY